VKAVDALTMERFLEMATQRLQGEWVIIGGAALTLMGVEERATLDINLAGPDEATTADTLALTEIAEELGLPVEAINQAASFFLRRIEGWQRHLVTLRRSEYAEIFRPDTTLFVLLKLARLTETDLNDCLKVLALARRGAEQLDLDRLLAAVGDAVKASKSPAKLERLKRLKDELSVASDYGS